MKFDIESNIRAVHVIKDSQLVFAYQREDVSDAQLFPAACIFKSFLSVLTGIAIYEGKMESLEDCVLNYFPHDEIRDSNWYRLKIKHALSKTTGLVWPGPGQPIPGNMGEVMKLPFENEPGAAF